MAATKKTEDTIDTTRAWEEDGVFGKDLKHAKKSTLKIEDIEAAVGLKSISIRMQENLIDDLKLIAKVEGIGYQPLIKLVLQRFVDGETRKHFRESLQRRLAEAEAAAADDTEAAKPRKRA